MQRENQRSSPTSLVYSLTLISFAVPRTYKLIYHFEVIRF